jgi:hypothetical protein
MGWLVGLRCSGIDMITQLGVCRVSKPWRVVADGPVPMSRRGLGSEVIVKVENDFEVNGLDLVLSGRFANVSCLSSYNIVRSDAE